MIEGIWEEAPEFGLRFRFVKSLDIEVDSELRHPLMLIGHITSSVQS
jgi:hypothetical protein